MGEIIERPYQSFRGRTFTREFVARADSASEAILTALCAVTPLFGFVLDRLDSQYCGFGNYEVKAHYVLSYIPWPTYRERLENGDCDE